MSETLIRLYMGGQSPEFIGIHRYNTALLLRKGRARAERYIKAKPDEAIFPPITYGKNSFGIQELQQ